MQKSRRNGGSQKDKCFFPSSLFFCVYIATKRNKEEGRMKRRKKRGKKETPLGEAGIRREKGKHP
jgi:hypothetical protein